MYWILLVSVAALFYWFIHHIYSYWDRKGVANAPPKYIFGNLKPVAKREKSFGIAIYDLYKLTKEPYLGLYLFHRPALLIRDVELVKNVLTKDFNYFHDRGVYCNEVRDPLSSNLFALPGQKWRNLRAKLTPTFTSGKIKNMFSTILDVGNKLDKAILEKAKNGEIIEIKNLVTCYTVDIIASVIFGFEVDSINNPEHEFREVGRKFTSNTEIRDVLRAVATFLCPNILEFFKLESLPQYASDFMIKIVKTTIDYREKENISRKDLMQLLLQIRNTGKTNQDGIWEVESVAENLKSMSIEQCAAQVFLFYIAGSETSSGAICFCLHELTQNPVVMEKLVKEIDEVLEKYKGEITYECLKEMSYLDLCLKESLRMYPGLPILNRECTQDYKIPNSNYTIEKGTAIIISLMGQHHDENNFSEPEKFIPERFLNEDSSKNFVSDAYMPFGDGPRNCIGFRLGDIVSKVALVLMLKNFKFEATRKEPMSFFNTSAVLLPKDGIKLRVTTRYTQQ